MVTLELANDVTWKALKCVCVFTLALLVLHCHCGMSLIVVALVSSSVVRSPCRQNCLVLRLDNLPKNASL